MTTNTIFVAAKIFTINVLFLFIIPTYSLAEKENYVDKAEVNKIVTLLQQSTKLSDYSKLKSFVTKDEGLIWDVCGPTDANPQKFTFDEVVSKLIGISRKSDIYVHHDVDTYLWNSNERISIVHIQTEGWNDELPYLNFLFKFSQKTNRWEWYGVCYDNVPPRVEGQYEPVYKRQPTLPRKGPRVFKNSRNLMVRIEEILKFKAFDALIPYAINSEIIFSECNPGLMGTFQMSGKKTPVDVVVDFLRKNDQKSNSAIVMAGNREMYLDTKGWGGTYPNISFWFAKGADGWQLSGIAYCKTSLFEMMFPNKK